MASTATATPEGTSEHSSWRSVFIYDNTVPAQPRSPILLGNVTTISLVVSARLTVYLYTIGASSEAGLFIEEAIPGYLEIGADNHLKIPPVEFKLSTSRATIRHSYVLFCSVLILPPPRAFLVLWASCWTLVVILILQHAPKDLRFL